MGTDSEVLPSSIQVPTGIHRILVELAHRQGRIAVEPLAHQQIPYSCVIEFEFHRMTSLI
ncbi:hypothetical protein B7R22_11765 [Subtercola boreus]|uniref:Uncharacterized protein n=1 Tax=Subtercola boreus TaxID=120213 RepID=A0A3E0VUM4_9MICO|nr:hypothetical protein B7R22_11765 [Subtercola boreus]